jgi:predicted transcriptional regulator of viral defense system
MTTKTLTLYKIKEMALNSNRAVYNTAQLSSLIGKDFNTASVYMTRLWKNGFAKHLLRGKISFVEDDFVIASQLIEPSYISLSSALLFHNVIQQVPRRIQSVTPVNSVNYDQLGLEYHKIPPGLMFGYERHKIGESYCFVATPEKALLDGYYLNHFTSEDLRSYLENRKMSEFKSFLEKFSGKGRVKLLEVTE